MDIDKIYIISLNPEDSEIQSKTLKNLQFFLHFL